VLPRLRTDFRWLVTPVRHQCAFAESASGYRSALPPRWQGEAGCPCSLLIVPAVLNIPPGLVKHIDACVRRGATVIIESGAGFAGHGNFRQHRRALRELLQVDVHAPVDLWSRNPRRAPYIDYTWPHPAKIRDFSRVVPLGDHPGEIIAWADGLPVAFKHRIERGTLIYFGSPLGPALWAGDAEARRWLSLTLRLHSTRLPLLHQ